MPLNVLANSFVLRVTSVKELPVKGMHMQHLTLLLL